MKPTIVSPGDVRSFVPPSVPDSGGSLNVLLLDDETKKLNGLALCYLGKKLSPEDKAVIHSQAERGALYYKQEYIDSLAKRIYANPSDTGSAPVAAYYSSWAVTKAEREIGNLAFKLRFHSPTEKEKAGMDQAIQELRNAQDIQLERPRTQMRRLLEEAKLVFKQRGIDGEAQVVEAVQMIDAVLRNMESFGEPSKSADPHKFHELYASPIKNCCELAVGRARNPWLFLDAFNRPRSEKDTFDQRWSQGMEAAAQEARITAEQLKVVLSPFARIWPSSKNEFDGEIYGATQEALRRI